MQRLSDEDTRILRLESEAIAGHTMKVAITEPAPGGSPVTVEGLRARVEARLGSMPRARERLAPTPLGIATPAWVDDEGFDIAAQVRDAAEPLTDRSALLRFAGTVMSERLDHSRPLWGIDVVGPDDQGRTALVVRIHHCLADGVTAVRMLSALLWDDDSGAQPGEIEPWSPRPAPGGARLIASGAASRLRRPRTGRGRGCPGRDLAGALEPRRSRGSGPAGDASPRALAARRGHGVRSIDRWRPRGRVHLLPTRGPEASRARRRPERDGERRCAGRDRRGDPPLVGEARRASRGNARPGAGQHAPP